MLSPWGSERAEEEEEEAAAAAAWIAVLETEKKILKESWREKEWDSHPVPRASENQEALA